MKKKTVNKNTKKIDEYLFRGILDRLGINMAKLSEEMGFHKSYVCAYARRGELSKFTITYLKNKYNVEYNEYKYMPNKAIPQEGTEGDGVEETIAETATEAPTTETVASPQTVIQISMEELTNAIYKAVYSACIAAWKDM